MRTILFSFAFLLFVVFIPIKSYSQKTTNDTITRFAKIQNLTTNNKVKFSADTPPLKQIAGAPKAFYSNFWEFGDGHYSTDKNPTHTYEKKGAYTTRLTATNNYDDGPPPTSRPTKVTINTDLSSPSIEDENIDLVATHHGFRLLNNREPSPNQEMKFVVSYANLIDYTTQGKLYVFFNEKKYKNRNFNLIDTRTYHGETEINEILNLAYQKPVSFKKLVLTSGIQSVSNKIVKDKDTIVKHNLPATLKEAEEVYQDYSVWEFDNLQPNEKRNVFLTFKTTPEMLKDTTAIISIRSVYVPERGSDAHLVRTKEMEIVTSHDPNKMAVYDTRINYRLMRFKPLKYKIRFQNNGEGSASLIKLNVDIPEMLDKSTLKVIDMYPKVPICPDGETVSYSCLDTIRMKEMISFQFKNIYLPGSNQKGVHEKDSTKGFVKYAMKFGKKVHKKRSRSRTAIIFDKNEPIITNTATSRFAMGLSIGVRAGYSILTYKKSNIESLVQKENFESSGKGFSTDITFSPYKSYKWYFQIESGFKMNELNSNSYYELVEEDATGIDYFVKNTNTIVKNTKSLSLVPASVRYNINGFLALGAGVQLEYIFDSKATGNHEKHYFWYNQDTQQPTDEELVDLYTNNTIKFKTSTENFDILPFVDVTIGASRIGPNTGVRYYYPLHQDYKILQFYAIWKF